VELREVLAARRMVRDFTDAPIAPDVLDRVLDAATRAPSAGFTQGVDLVVLTGSDETARYWDATLAPARRPGFAWPGLLAAPVLVVVCATPDAYVARYAEADKARTGLGVGADAWAVPYWFVDAGMAAENLLLAAVDAGLGACFFGVFDHEPALRAALGIPPTVRTVGTIALGHPAPASRPGRSAGRPRRGVGDVAHRGGW
jgi:nitroreductase